MNNLLNSKKRKIIKNSNYVQNKNEYMDDNKLQESVSDSYSEQMDLQHLIKTYSLKLMNYSRKKPKGY